MVKYILVSGSCVSGLGKGISCSSIGTLLKSHGFHLTAIKIDPYLSTTSGCLRPSAHGETAVTADGNETDLDILNYERFLDVTLTKHHSITTGKINTSILHKESVGTFFLGETIQLFPHVTDEIQQWIKRAAVIPVDGTGQIPEIVMIELGGVVTGDMETAIYAQALAQMRQSLGPENFFHVHVSLVPYLGEFKTKLVQHACTQLRALNLPPDILLCRTDHKEEKLSEEIKNKISRFCFIPATHVVENPNLDTIYQVPQILHESNVPELIMNQLKLSYSKCKWPQSQDCMREDCAVCTNLEQWNDFIQAKENLLHRTVAVVRKYTSGSDCYLSVVRSLEHAGTFNDRCYVNIRWVDAESKDIEGQLKGADGILVPGGFGVRGIEGKIKAIRYARENRIPFLGVCLGFQLALIQFARDVCNIENATSEEFDENAATENRNIIKYMPEIDKTTLAGNMRLGARETRLMNGSLAKAIYHGKSVISERHRHRYEFNDKFTDIIKQHGMHLSGYDVETGTRLECIELPTHVHPFFFAVQFHPEFQSRPNKPSPPFSAFIDAMI